jgi:hypothetical protein
MAVYSKTFVGTDGTDLPSHDADWVATSGAPPNLEIQGNTATGTDSGGSFNSNRLNQAVTTAHYVKCTPHASYAEYVGGTVRHQAGANSYFYLIRRNDGVVFCGELIAGSATDWDAGTAGFTTSDTYELHADASTSTTFYLKKNGTTVTTFTSKSALSGGSVGICAVNVLASQGLSAWEGGDVAGGGSTGRGRLVGGKLVGGNLLGRAA